MYLYGIPICFHGNRCWNRSAQGDTPAPFFPDGMWFLFVSVALASLLVTAEKDEYLGIELLQVEMTFKSIETNKGHCLRFMHIPKTGGTSIDAASMHQSIAPYGSLMRDTYERIATARHFDGDIGDLYEDSHRDAVSYGLFLMKNGQFYHMLPENASEQCEDLHTPPSWDPMIQKYYEKCETFCAIRNPLERFWSAYRMFAGTQSSEFCDPDFIETFVNEALQEAKERPYYHDCFLVPQVEFVYGSRNWSHATRQYCTRLLHQENLTKEFDELMMEIGRPEVKLPEEDLMSSWSGCSNVSTSDLNLATRKAIYEFYKEDYEAFGYAPPKLTWTTSFRQVFELPKHVVFWYLGMQQKKGANKRIIIDTVFVWKKNHLRFRKTDLWNLLGNVLKDVYLIVFVGEKVQKLPSITPIVDNPTVRTVVNWFFPCFIWRPCDLATLHWVGFSA